MKKIKRCFASFRSKQFLEKLTESTIYQITCVNNIKFLLLIFVIAQFSSFVLKSILCTVTECFESHIPGGTNNLLVVDIKF